MLDIQDSARTLVARSTEFLLEEAERLDARRLEEWTSLFADDAVYWLPIDPDQAAPGDGLNIIYDDRPRLLDRVSRLSGGLASPDEPHSPPSPTLWPPRRLDGERAQAAAGGRVLLPGDHAVAARCV